MPLCHKLTSHLQNWLPLCNKEHWPDNAQLVFVPGKAFGLMAQSQPIRKVLQGTIAIMLGDTLFIDPYADPKKTKNKVKINILLKVVKKLGYMEIYNGSSWSLQWHTLQTGMFHLLGFNQFLNSLRWWTALQTYGERPRRIKQQVSNQPISFVHMTQLTWPSCFLRKPLSINLMRYKLWQYVHTLKFICNRWVS